MLQEPQKVADLITEAGKGSAKAAANHVARWRTGRSPERDNELHLSIFKSNGRSGDKRRQNDFPRKALSAVSSFNGAIYPGGRKTGAFFVEALHPYEMLTAAGFEVVWHPKTGTCGFDDVSLTPPFLSGSEHAILNNPKVYKGAPHGMCTTLKDRVNQDLLAFIKS
jgi:hypothetical protein